MKIRVTVSNFYGLNSKKSKQIARELKTTQKLVILFPQHKISKGYLRVLGLGDVNKDFSSRMNNVKKLHDCSTIIGDGNVALVIVNELVHTPWS